MADPVLRASGLRTVAVATVLGLAVVVLRFVLDLAAASRGYAIEPARLELVSAFVGLSAATIGMLWSWGAIRAARADERAGTGLFAPAATLALVTVGIEAFVCLDPLIQPKVSLTANASETLVGAARVCWVAAHLVMALALARLAWKERRGVVMVAAAAAFVVSGPMLILDPVALALDRLPASLAGARWLGTLPALAVGAGIAMAAVNLPLPKASLWRSCSRSLELSRAGLGGIVVVAVGFMAGLALGDAEPAKLRTALTGPLLLLAMTTAVGAFGTSRLSIRWSRWSFRAAAVLLVAVGVIEVVVGAIVPVGVVTATPFEVVVTELVGLALAVLALASLVLGCARLDAALRRPAIAPAVSLALAAAAATAAVVLGHQPITHGVTRVAIIGAALLLAAIAIVMTLRLLGKGAIIAEDRAFGDRGAGARRAAARQGRLVHEHWRAAHTH